MEKKRKEGEIENKICPRSEEKTFDLTVLKKFNKKISLSKGN